jgi:hypothetical protein
MATKRLDNGWTLFCGVWPPFLMPAPQDIVTALREQGILRREPVGLDALYNRWVESQAWIYTLEFDCPDDENERSALRFEKLSGKGSVHLNGRVLTNFESGELTVDITGNAQPEKNRLEVRFTGMLSSNIPRGILGSVWLRQTNYVELKRVRAVASDGVIRVASDLTAHTAGRFLFRYQVSLDDEMALTSEIFERLKAADAHMEHVLKLPAPVKWDGEQYYTVRLTVERSGVGCDSVLLNVAMDPPRPRRIAQVPDGLHGNRDLLRALRDMGADAVLCSFVVDKNVLIPSGFLPDGLLTADGTEDADGMWYVEEDDYIALPRRRELERLAGGERYWPPGTPVWHAMGSPCPNPQALEACFGANVLGDASRYARLSRFVQAETIRAKALTARREGRAFAVIATEDAPLLASPSLIEHSGKKRPAYEALRQAWGDLAAFELPDAFRAQSPIKVWIFSESRAKRPVTVTASVYALDGKLLASTSFTALTGETASLGDLRVSLPEEGVVIARAEITDGGKTKRIDQVLCFAKPGAPERGALLNPPRAELRLQGGELCVTGQTAALGVYAGSFYGALLPGEKVALAAGIAPEDIESLNGQIL